MQLGDHLGDIRRALNDEMEWASGGVYWVRPVDFADALEGMDGAGREWVAMVVEEDLEAIEWGHGARRSPADLDLVEVGPLKDLGGDSRADEGEVLQDPRGPIALLALSTAYVERINGDRAEGEVEL